MMEPTKLMFALDDPRRLDYLLSLANLLKDANNSQYKVTKELNITITEVMGMLIPEK